MGDPFGGEEGQGEQGKRNLKSFSAELGGRNGPLAPLRRRPFAEIADSPNDKEVDQRAQQGEEQHGNANGVLMKSFGGSVDAGSSGQSGKADGHANAANGDDCGAGALQDGEGDSRPA